jgi:hypothetical protein
MQVSEPGVIFAFDLEKDFAVHFSEAVRGSVRLRRFAFVPHGVYDARECQGTLPASSNAKQRSAIARSLWRR